MPPKAAVDEHGVPLSYMTRHRVVYRERGRADSYDCIDCGQKARQWSQIHDTTGASADHYQPRCHHCHHRYDEIPEKTSAAKSGRPLSAAHRAAIANAMNQDHIKEFMSNAMKGKPWSAARRTAQQKGKTVKVSVYQTIEITDEQRKEIGKVLGVKWPDRDQLKEFFWTHGANWQDKLTLINATSEAPAPAELDELL